MELKVLKPKKEYVVLRKARKSHRCHECDCEIRRGTCYIEDHICYVRRRREGSGFLWRVSNKICLVCWRGPIPVCDVHL